MTSPYATDRFLDYLYQHASRGQDLESCERDRLPALCAQKKEQLAALLGLNKLQSFSMEPSLSFTRRDVHRGYSLEFYDFTFLPELTVPAYVLVPDHPNGKAILYMNGHGPGVETVLQETSQPPLCAELARQGYLVFTAELMGFGEVLQESNLNADHRGCIGNGYHLLLHGMTEAGLRVYECRRLIDEMNKLHLWDALGSYGMSGGGMLNTLMFALEPRIDAACIANYPNTFRDSILSMHHCLCNYYPGILEIGEIAHLIFLGAPRPVLLSCGDHDPIFPLAGSLCCRDTLHQLYGRLGQESQVEFELFDGGHEISTAAVYDFFARRL